MQQIGLSVNTSKSTVTLCCPSTEYFKQILVTKVSLPPKNCCLKKNTCYQNILFKLTVNTFAGVSVHASSLEHKYQ